MFTECDHKQFREKDISPHVVEEQLAIFRRGIPFTKLARPCTIGDGITVLTSSDLDSYAKVFHQALFAAEGEALVTQGLCDPLEIHDAVLERDDEPHPALLVANEEVLRVGTGQVSTMSLRFFDGKDGSVGERVRVDAERLQSG